MADALSIAFFSVLNAVVGIAHVCATAPAIPPITN